MRHLLSILESNTPRLMEVYRFLFDRFRSLRQDITLQGLQDDFAVAMYERMARFHVLASHELCHEQQTAANPDGFNAHLNIEQLQKCMASLFHMYDVLAARGLPQPREGEFRAFNILLQARLWGFLSAFFKRGFCGFLGAPCTQQRN